MNRKALIPIGMATLLLGVPVPAGAVLVRPNTYSIVLRYVGTLVEHRETPGATLRDGSPGPPDLADLAFKFNLGILYSRINILDPNTFPTKVAVDATGTWSFATNSNSSLKTTCEISATELPQDILPFPANPQVGEDLNFRFFIPLNYATVGKYVSGGDPSLCSPKRPRAVDLGVTIPNDGPVLHVRTFPRYGGIKEMDAVQVSLSGSSGADTWSIEAVARGTMEHIQTNKVADPFNVAASSQGSASDSAVPPAPVTQAPVTPVTSKASAKVEQTVKKPTKKKTIKRR